MNTYISKCLHNESNIFFSNVYREEYNNVSSKCFNKMNKIIYNDKCKQLDWNNISSEIDEYLVEGFEYYIKWNYLSSSNKLSENFIIKYSDKLNWDNVSMYQKLSEGLIDKYWYKLNWNFLYEYHELSEYLMEKYHN